MISRRCHSALYGCLVHDFLPEVSHGSLARVQVPARHSRCGASKALRARGSPPSHSILLDLNSSQMVQGIHRGVGSGPVSWRRSGCIQEPQGVRRAVRYAVKPSVQNSGTQPGANPWGTGCPTRCALARVRLPPSTPTSPFLVGSLAVHTQQGERSRRVIASASLMAPALRARSTAYTAASWSCSTCRSHRKEAEQARSGSATATSQCRPVCASTSQTRAVARRPRPAAQHATTRTISSTAACLPWKSVPGVSRKSPFQAGQWNWRQGPPLGGPLARRCPSPSPPREAPSLCGHKCLEVSTSRGRRWVGAMGAGGTAEGALGDAVSRSHRAQ